MDLSWHSSRHFRPGAGAAQGTVKGFGALRSGRCIGIYRLRQGFRVLEDFNKVGVPGFGIQSFWLRIWRFRVFGSGTSRLLIWAFERSLGLHGVARFGVRAQFRQDYLGILEEISQDPYILT